MFTMAHNETDILDRLRQIASGNLRHAKNISVTNLAHRGIDFRLQIMWIGLGVEQVERHSVMRNGTSNESDDDDCVRVPAPALSETAPLGTAS
jgi:hypothetical protein